MQTKQQKRGTRLFAVILAGGRGERFWPLGRASRPKQFVDLFGGKPLIRHAVDRLRGLVPPSRILVVTNRDLVEATREALPHLPPSQIIGEPMGRDTAAACALATAYVAAKGKPSDTLCILTADHLIADAQEFRRILAAASDVCAKRDVMGLIGITPTRPATGYGYVELGAPVGGDSIPAGFRKVVRFVEKPNLGTAATYVASGKFAWNSGMFVWRAETFLAALRRFRPALAEAVETRIAPAFSDPKRLSAALERVYPTLEKISVDYAIMEKASNLVAIRGAFGWDDVGTWPSAGSHLPQDGNGNATSGLVTALAAEGNVLVNTQKRHVLAAMGVKGLIAIHTPDATLVCSREAADGLKALVRRLSESKTTAFSVQ